MNLSFAHREDHGARLLPSVLWLAFVRSGGVALDLAHASRSVDVMSSVCALCACVCDWTVIPSFSRRDSDV